MCGSVGACSASSGVAAAATKSNSELSLLEGKETPPHSRQHKEARAVVGGLALHARPAELGWLCTRFFC